MISPITLYIFFIYVWIHINIVYSIILVGIYKIYRIFAVTRVQVHIYCSTIGTLSFTRQMLLFCTRELRSFKVVNFMHSCCCCLYNFYFLFYNFKIFYCVFVFLLLLVLYICCCCCNCSFSSNFFLNSLSIRTHRHTYLYIHMYIRDFRNH